MSERDSSNGSRKGASKSGSNRARSAAIYNTTRIVNKHLERAAKWESPPEQDNASARAPRAAKPPPSPEDISRRIASEQWEELKGYEPWASLDPQHCVGTQNALRSKKCVYTVVARDSLIEHQGRAICVLSGQVVLAFVENNWLAYEKSRQQRLASTVGVKTESAAEVVKEELERRRIEGILSRRMAFNVAYFQSGEVVDVQSLVSELLPLEDKYPGCSLCIFTSANSALLSVLHDEFIGWSRTLGNPISDYLQSGQSSALNRLPGRAGVSPRANDFLIRQGLSIADTVRLLDQEHCISCRACEQACSALYGRNRLRIDLGSNFYQFKAIGACRTCVDQRCVSACIYDAIQFDIKKGEVIIDDFNCTGCSECSTACPYDAIEMRQTDASLPFGAKLELRIVQQNQERSTRQEKPRNIADTARRRIANKCDHCQSYDGQQACLAACPGGAPTLFELSPTDAVLALSAKDPDWKPTQKIAPAKHDYRQVTALWAISLLFFFIGSIEVLLRIMNISPRSKGVVALFLSLRKEGAFLNFSQYPHDLTLIIAFGAIGTVLMFFAMMFILRRIYMSNPMPIRTALGRCIRSIIMEVLGNIKFHSWAGTAAILFITLHSFGRFSQFEAVSASVAFAITAISGIVIRLCGTTGKALIAKAQSGIQSWSQEVQPLRASGAELSAIEALCIQLTSEYRAATTGRGAVWSALWLLVRDGISSKRYKKRLEKMLGSGGLSTAKRDFSKLLESRIRWHRHIVVLPALDPIGTVARLGHLPFSIVLAIITIAHIAVSVSRFRG